MTEIKLEFSPSGALMEIYEKPTPLSDEDLKEIEKRGHDGGTFVYIKDTKTTNKVEVQSPALVSNKE